jgi:truncated hemoglobin YjbI
VLTPWPPDCDTQTQSRLFVRQFAHRVASDPLLGPTFPGQHHTPADCEYAWWEQALTGSLYTGRPLHREATPPFTPAQISRWCTLLEESLHDAFGGPAANEIKGHVLNLATMLAHWQLSQQCDDTGKGLLSEAITTAW